MRVGSEGGQTDHAGKFKKRGYTRDSTCSGSGLNAREVGQNRDTSQMTGEEKRVRGVANRSEIWEEVRRPAARKDSSKKNGI